MPKNYVSPDLVTLDARQPHPGFDPFRAAKEARAARATLAAMKLPMREQVAVIWALNGATPPVPLSDELAALVETARKVRLP